MRLSKYYLPTLKDVSKDVVLASHKLMLRAGMIKQCSSGLYTILPIGFKVMRKIENIVQEELDKIGAMRVSMPIITDEKIWAESGRIDSYGEEMLRFSDRSGHKLIYSPTNEEAIVDVFRGQISSYKQLPISLYQINWKFRDEIRPRFGLMRAREFLMMDNYSFANDITEAEEIYNKNCEAYLKAFRRMGLKVLPMQADNGAIGGTFSCEFHVLADSGESAVFYDENSYKKYCELYDKQDFSLKEIQSIANGKTWAFTEEKYDKLECEECGYNIKQKRGIEVGHVFIFGDKYTKSMNVTVTGANGKSFYPQMGSYGIGITRVMAAAIEANHDDKGIIWTKSLSPFDVILINLDPNDKDITALCDKKYEELLSKGIDVLYDDTFKTIGEKFAIADLIGITKQIVIGKKSFPNFEEKNRS